MSNVKEPEGTGNEAVAWARAVLWAVDNIHVARMTKRKAGHPTRYALWQFGREDPKALTVQLASKAAEILRKEAKLDEAAIEAAEARSIEELQELLDAAISEADI